jgi:hypothetical protein
MAKKKKGEQADHMEPMEPTEQAPDEAAVKLNEKMSRCLAEVASEKSKEETKYKKERALYSQNEWTLDDTPPDDKQLSLRLPKAIVETVVGSVLENRFDSEVLADELPHFPPGHPFSQMLDQYRPFIMARSVDEAKIVGEMLTHALSSLNESLRIDEHTEWAVESALEHAHVYLKDGVSLYSRDTLTVSRVPKTRIYKDKHAKTWDGLDWLCEKIPITKDELLTQFPEQKPEIEKALEECNHDEEDHKKPELEEWWFRDREMVEEGGVLVPKFPGYWKQAFRIGSVVIKFPDGECCRPNPFSHGRLPYHILVGVTDPDSVDGLSLVSDILFGMVTGMNQATSRALWALLQTSHNQRVWNTDTLLEPEKIGDVSVTNLKSKPGVESLDLVVKELNGQQVSPAFFQVADMLGSRITDISGVGSIPPAGTPNPANDILHSGFRKGQLRRRVKGMLESLAFNLIHNLITFVEDEKAFRVMGGIGSESYMRFNPHIFAELLENFNARFTIHVNDEELLPTNPMERGELTSMMMDTAGALAEKTGLPLSEAIGLLPNMPHKSTLQRQVLRVEMQREQERQAAIERGDPDPLQAEINAQAEKERKTAGHEVMKKTLQKVSDQDVMVALALGASGIQERLFRLDEMGLEEVADTLAMVEQLNAQLPHPIFGILLAGLMLKQQKLQEAMQMQMMAQQQAEPAPMAGQA